MNWNLVDFISGGTYSLKLLKFHDLPKFSITKVMWSVTELSWHCIPEHILVRCSTGKPLYVFAVNSCLYETNRIYEGYEKSSENCISKFTSRSEYPNQVKWSINGLMCGVFSPSWAIWSVFLWNYFWPPWDAKCWLVDLKWPACLEFLWLLSLATIILRKLYSWLQHWFSLKMLEVCSNLAKR